MTASLFLTTDVPETNPTCNPTCHKYILLWSLAGSKAPSISEIFHRALFSYHSNLRLSYLPHTRASQHVEATRSAFPLCSTFLLPRNCTLTPHPQPNNAFTRSPRNSASQVPREGGREGGSPVAKAPAPYVGRRGGLFGMGYCFPYCFSSPTRFGDARYV